jgi:hypothetical protein
MVKGTKTALISAGAQGPILTRCLKAHDPEIKAENPQACGFSRCFLVGRAGLEPTTLCLKDCGGLFMVSSLSSQFDISQ